MNSYGNRRQSRPVRRGSGIEDTGEGCFKLSLKLIICLLLCLAAWGMKNLMPDRVKAVSAIISGSEEKAYSEAFVAFGRAVYDDMSVAAALRELYNEVLSTAFEDVGRSAGEN